MASRGRLFIGKVFSNKAAKTITVKVPYKIWNTKYQIWIQRTSKLYAHDEHEVCNIGDEVEIQESRPYSATKRFVFKRVVKAQPQLTSPLPPPQNFAPFVLGHAHNAPSAATAAARVGAGVSFTANVPANPVSYTAAAAPADAPAASAAAGAGTESIGADGKPVPYIRDNKADHEAQLEAARAARRAQNQSKRISKKQKQAKSAAAAARGEGVKSFQELDHERMRVAQKEESARRKQQTREDAVDDVASSVPRRSKPADS